MQSAVHCRHITFLSRSPLPADLAVLHLEVSGVTKTLPSVAAAVVTWALKEFLKCGKLQRTKDAAGN